MFSNYLPYSSRVKQCVTLSNTVLGNSIKSLIGLCLFFESRCKVKFLVDVIEMYLCWFQLLSKPENCCGLKESEVLSLLNDVGTSTLFVLKCILCIQISCAFL